MGKINSFPDTRTRANEATMIEVLTLKMADVKAASSPVVANKTSGVALSQLPLQQLEYLKNQIEDVRLPCWFPQIHS